MLFQSTFFDWQRMSTPDLNCFWTQAGVVWLGGENPATPLARAYRRYRHWPIELLNTSMAEFRQNSGEVMF